MPSENETPSPVLIQFPNPRQPAVLTEEEKAVARQHADDIVELIRGTSMALQELRHGVANCLLGILEKLNLDTWTLVNLLDERPSVVRGLMAGETEGITTERLLEFLERLRM